MPPLGFGLRFFGLQTGRFLRRRFLRAAAVASTSAEEPFARLTGRRLAGVQRVFYLFVVFRLEACAISTRSSSASAPPSVSVIVPP